MFDAEIPIPALVAYLNAVQEDIKTPRHLEHANFGRLRYVPMPAPRPSIWYGHVTPHDASEGTQLLFEVQGDTEPSLLQEATARALARGWKVIYLPQMSGLLDEVIVRLSAQGLAALGSYDARGVALGQIRIPSDPLRESIRLTVRDVRAPRYNVVVPWRDGKPTGADVEDRFMPGVQVIDGAPISAE